MEQQPGKKWGEWGEYGQRDASDQRVTMRRPTALETKHLAKQEHFVFFLPQLVLVECRNSPDVFEEYCSEFDVDLELVYWDLDAPLIPPLDAAGIRTTCLFGVPKRYAESVINYARGVILQDEGEQKVFRLLPLTYRLIAPGVSLAKPAEKLLAEMIDIVVLSIQTPSALWTVGPNSPPVDFHIRKDKTQGDPNLCQVMERFWKRGHRTDILQTDDDLPQ